jgi:hypothetical protein
MSVHLVVYSHGEPFDSTKKMITSSIHDFTTKNVIIHDYNLDIIKTRDWFKKIECLPDIHKPGRRDGYYCAYKAFITHEVYQLMKDDDILYYVDSSQYFREGFTQSIDKLCDIAVEKGCVAGSIGIDVCNLSYRCCDDPEVWSLIGVDIQYLNKPHVLSAWYIFTKNETNSKFMDEWIMWDVYNGTRGPLVTYHHTGDQAIYNILVIKYNLPVFHHPEIGHDANKDKNRVLQVSNIEQFLRYWSLDTK